MKTANEFMVDKGIDTEQIVAYYVKDGVGDGIDMDVEELMEGYVSYIEGELGIHKKNDKACCVLCKREVEEPEVDVEDIDMSRHIADAFSICDDCADMIAIYQLKCYSRERRQNERL